MYDPSDDSGKNRPPSGVSWRTEEEPMVGATPAAPAAVGRLGLPMDDLVIISRFLKWIADRDGIVVLNTANGRMTLNVERDYMHILGPLVEDVVSGRIKWS